MDKYEFNIKVEQIKKMVNKNDFATAMKIADTIDWRRVRNANLLSMISQVYEKNREYQEAKEVLLLAYERAPIGKRLLYKLTELALKEGSIEEAEDYYREFCDLAPEDTRQHILGYLILREKEAPIDQLIRMLERYTATELEEKWMYELAELYAKAGRTSDCIQLCDKMILLFGVGMYVERAMDLKQKYAPLTRYQRNLVENKDVYEERLRAVEEEYENRTGSMWNYENQGISTFGTGGDTTGSWQNNRAYDSGNGYGTGGTYGVGGGYNNTGNYQNQGNYQDNGAYEGERNYDSRENYEAGGAYGNQGNYGTGQFYGNEGAYGVNETYGPEGNYRGNMVYGTDTSYGNENVYGTGTPYANENSYGTGEVYGNGTGYGTGEVYGNEAAYGTGEAYGNENGYGTGEAYGNENGYGGGVVYGNGTNYGGGAAYGTGENYETEGAYQGQGVSQTYERETNYQGRDQYETGRTYKEQGRITNISERYNRSDRAYMEENSAYGSSQDNSYVQDNRNYGNGPSVVSGIEGVDEELMANIRQAAAEKELAAEMSKISTEGYVEPEFPSGNTKVFKETARNRNIPYIRPQMPDEDVGRERKYRRSYIPHHLIVDAKMPEEGLKAALEALKKIHEEGGITNQVIKITGSKLSRRGIFQVSDKLMGKDLIIEEAGDLSQRDLEELQMLMERDETGMIVVLIDNPLQVENLRRENPGFINLFQNINIDNDESEITEDQWQPEEPEEETIAEVIRESKEQAVAEEDTEEENQEVMSAQESDYAQNRRESSDQDELEEDQYDNADGEEYEDEEYSEDEYEDEEYSEEEYEGEEYPEEEYEDEEYPEEEYEDEEYSEEEYEDDEYSEEEYENDEYSEEEYEEDEYSEEEYENEEYIEDENEEYEEDNGELAPIDDEELDLNEFANYAVDYAKEIDCNITGKSMLALYERIEIMEEDGIPLTRANAEDLIEEAADKAEKPSLGGLIKGVFSSKYDKDGLLILKEEHFI